MRSIYPEFWSLDFATLKNLSVFSGGVVDIVVAIFVTLGRYTKCYVRSNEQNYNFIKKRLQHRCFPVSITKFFRTSFYRIPPGDCF